MDIHSTAADRRAQDRRKDWQAVPREMA